MITAIKQYFIRIRAARRAFAALQQAAYDATTPERCSAGYYDIKRLIAWRYRRVQKGHDLHGEICGLTCDIGRLYVTSAQVARARLGAFDDEGSRL